jgi:hypothetical protein
LLTGAGQARRWRAASIEELKGTRRMAVLQRPTPGAIARRVGIPGLGIIAAGFVAAAALLPVAQSSTATATGNTIRRLEAQRADLQASIYAGQSEVATLGATERIDREARERLGMVPATSWLYVTVDDAPPTAGVPARFLEKEVPTAPPATHQSWWKAALSKLPLP